MPKTVHSWRNCSADAQQSCGHGRHADEDNPPLQEGLPAFAPDPAQARYRYVLFDIWFLTVTRRSVALGAKAAALTFTALQVMERATDANHLDPYLSWCLWPQRWRRPAHIALTALAAGRGTTTCFRVLVSDLPRHRVRLWC